MKGLLIAVVTLAVVATGALLAGAEESSQCSASLPDGTVCRVTCDGGRTAVCRADSSRVGCSCKDSSSRQSSDDFDGGEDVGDNGEGDDGHESNDGNDSRSDGSERGGNSER